MIKRASVIAFVLLAVAGTRGHAMTSEGTLLTNVACASYWSADDTQYKCSYSSSANVIVMNPAIQLRKTATPTMQCSGGTINFCIYVVNTSAMSSAFNVTIEDILPGDGTGNGFSYMYPGGRSEWNPQGLPMGAGGITYGYRPTNFGANNIWPGYVSDPELDGEPANGVVGPYYIRWNIAIVGPNRSMMVCFKASVL